MNTDPRFRAVSLACLSALSACGGPAPAKHLLRYAFEPGKVAHAVMSNQTTTKGKVGEKVLETTMNMQLFLSSTVVEVKDGIAQVRMVIDRVKFATRSQGVDIDYDSDVEGSKPGLMGPIVSVIGKAMEMRVDGRGNVSDARLPEELKEVQGVDLEELTLQHFQVLPEEPVAIGATWEDERSVSMGVGKSTMKVQYELLKVADGKATLGEVLRMDLSDLKMPGKMKVEVEEASGTAIVGLSSWIPEGTMHMVMTTKGAGMDMRMEHTIGVQPCEAPKKGK